MMGPAKARPSPPKTPGNWMKLSRYGRLTMAEFAAKFKEPLLGRAFLAAIPGYYKASALVATLASMHGGDSGYPLGGSRAFARRMEQKYLDLGGKAFYNARVEKIVVKDGRATGLRLADGREISGDYVISCADAHATLFDMLEDRYTTDVFRNLFDHPESYPTPTSAMVFMGVGCEIKEDCASLTLRRKEPVLLCGFESEAVGLLNYGFDRTMAPPGKTVVACLYEADYDYWNGLDKEEYLAEKEQLKQDAARVLIGRYPEADGKIEATDAVTPLTYVRYCNAWRGSWMSWGESRTCRGITRAYCPAWTGSSWPGCGPCRRAGSPAPPLRAVRGPQALRDGRAAFQNRIDACRGRIPVCVTAKRPRPRARATRPFSRPLLYAEQTRTPAFAGIRRVFGL